MPAHEVGPADDPQQWPVLLGRVLVAIGALVGAVGVLIAFNLGSMAENRPDLGTLDGFFECLLSLMVFSIPGAAIASCGVVLVRRAHPARHRGQARQTAVALGLLASVGFVVLAAAMSGAHRPPKPSPKPKEPTLADMRAREATFQAYERKQFPIWRPAVRDAEQRTARRLEKLNGGGTASISCRRLRDYRMVCGVALRDGSKSPLRWALAAHFDPRTQRVKIDTELGVP